MSSQPAKQIKILIVDDSAAISSLLKTILSNLGYKVTGELPTGKHLLKSIEKMQPDVVFLDYNLPDSNGLELLANVKSSYPEVAVVMITGSKDLALDKAAAEIGAAGFIRKPFTENKIVKDLEQIVQAIRFLGNTDKTTLSEGQDKNKPHRATAVIADDSSTMRAMLTAILANKGIHVLGEASNGTQVVELVEEHQPDIVCLDIEMPAMNGLVALQLIREKNPTTKIMMITANANKESVMEASKHGATGFIVKPFLPEKVDAALEKLLSL